MKELALLFEMSFHFMDKIQILHLGSCFDPECYRINLQFLFSDPYSGEDPAVLDGEFFCHGSGLF
jgi:hypothetical protein